MTREISEAPQNSSEFERRLCFPEANKDQEKKKRRRCSITSTSSIIASFMITLPNPQQPHVNRVQRRRRRRRRRGGGGGGGRRMERWTYFIALSQSSRKPRMERSFRSSTSNSSPMSACITQTSVRSDCLSPLFPIVVRSFVRFLLSPPPKARSPFLAPSSFLPYFRCAPELLVSPHPPNPNSQDSPSLRSCSIPISVCCVVPLLH